MPSFSWTRMLFSRNSHFAVLPVRVFFCHDGVTTSMWVQHLQSWRHRSDLGCGCDCELLDGEDEVDNASEEKMRGGRRGRMRNLCGDEKEERKWKRENEGRRELEMGKGGLEDLETGRWGEDMRNEEKEMGRELVNRHGANTLKCIHIEIILEYDNESKLFYWNTLLYSKSNTYKTSEYQLDTRSGGGFGNVEKRN